MESERVIIEAPLSFTGSAKRINRRFSQWFISYPLIACAWLVVLSWYLFFGIWLIPYRLIRRSQRKQKLETLRHRESLGVNNYDKN